MEACSRKRWPVRFNRWEFVEKANAVANSHLFVHHNMVHEGIDQMLPTYAPSTNQLFALTCASLRIGTRLQLTEKANRTEAKYRDQLFPRGGCGHGVGSARET